MIKNFNKRRGVGLIEVVIGSAIITLSIAGLVSIFNLYLSKTINLTSDIKAEFLLKEGMEAVISMRNESWSNLEAISSGSPTFFEFSENLWKATTTNIYVDDKFERSFVLEDVYRDENDNIGPTGTMDGDSKKIIVSVSFFDGEATTTKSLSSYLNNLLKN